ncbi:MarC family transcriptional regulator [filamentous cyanobacterium CCP1]|nr:MarC family transcriptional regulator [filamentous cyanobacterium CCP2]PSB68507.1 MarC family transcriptional regulator [filamentous cyanobacterium CCP1]
MDVGILVRTFVAVFVLADALGNAPIVLILTKGMEASERNQVVDRATVVATTVLLVFAFIGQPILNYLHISIGSLQVAGGLLLLLIALDMLNGKLDEPIVEGDRDVAITPLALPLLAGPGTLTTVMLLMSEAPDAHVSVIVGILGAMLVSWLIFRQANRVSHWIGAEGALIAMKLLGFLLAALAVEIGSEGIRQLFLT